MGDIVNMPAKMIFDDLMVVEDNRMNQRYIGKLLDTWKVRYTLATDGKKAVDAAQKQLFSIILMDIQMPVMDGYEAVLAIRNTPNPNQHVAIIALTASNTPDCKSKALAVGMNDFLPKPFEPNQLYALLEKYKLPAVTNPPIVNTQKTTPMVLDRQQLEIMYGDDKEYAIEMFATFLEEVLPEFSTFADRVTKKDWYAVGRLAHKLKPTLSMVGLTMLDRSLNRVIKLVNGLTEHPSDETELQQLCANFERDLEQMLPLVRDELDRISP